MTAKKSPAAVRPAAKRAPRKVSAEAAERANARLTGADIAAAVKASKRTAKPAAVKPAAEVVESTPWDATLADLTAVQAQIDEKLLAERRDAADPLMVRRNELILAAIAQGAGFAAIARARGVSSSTNRGLCRVLQGGKRI
jgi:hypothetical protein